MAPQAQSNSAKPDQRGGSFANGSAADFVKSWITATANLPRRRRLDALMGLERLDENFHRYAFVKHIERRIDAFVSTMLDARLGKLQGAPHVEIPVLVEEIMNSAEYTSFVKGLLEDANESVTKVLNHEMSSTTVATGSTDHDNMRQRQQDKQELRKMSSDFSTPSNSTNESATSNSFHTNSASRLSCIFIPMLSIDEIRTVSTNLQPRNNLDVRLAAMQRLGSYPSMDLLCGDFWPESRLALNTALCDADTRIVIGSLRIYARAFRAAPPPMMGELYLSLVGHLTHIFDSAHFGKVVDGLCIEDLRVQLLLRKFRLLNQFQKEMTSCWIRFPEQLVKDIMLATFKFLNMSSSVPGWNHRMKSSILTGTAPGNSSHITPLHYLSIVDIGATWFEKWMISQFGRSHITSALIEAGMLGDLAARFVAHAAHLLRVSSSISKTCDEVLVLDVEVSEDPDELVARRKIGMEDLEYVHFLHVLVMIGKLSVFDVGRRCFPIDLTEALGSGIVPALKNILGKSFGSSGELSKIPATDPSSSLSLPAMTNILIRLMCHCPRTTFSMYAEEDRSRGQNLEALKLSRFIVRLLREITVTDKIFDQRLLENAVLCELLEPLRLATAEKKGTTEIDPESLLDVAETLSNIAATYVGRKYLLEQEAKAKAQDPKEASTTSAEQSQTEPHILETVAAFVKRAVTAGPISRQQVKVLGAYVFFLQQLYRTCEGLRHLQRHDLHMTLATTLKDENWLRDADRSADSLSKKWHPMAVDNLLNFAGTPKGVLLLQLSGSMNPCVAYMAHRYEKKMQVSKCDKFGYGFLVSQISTTKSGMQALYSSGLFQLFFSDMWALLEHDDTVSVAVPHIEPLDDHLAKKLVGNLLKVLASFPGLVAIIEAEQSTSGRNTLDFLMRSILLNANANTGHEPSPGRYDESQLIALKILMLATSSLDSYVLLQERYKFRDSLLSTQASYAEIIDETSLLRKFIYVATHTMGGPGERRLPPTNLQEALKEPHHAQLRTDYYCPDIGPIKPEPVIVEVQKQLNALLAKVTHGANWILHIQEALAKGIGNSSSTSGKGVQSQQLFRLLPRIVKTITHMPEADRAVLGWTPVGEPNQKPDDVKATSSPETKPSGYDNIATLLAVRYAKRHIPGLSEEQLQTNLVQVLCECRKLIKPHQISENVLGCSTPAGATPSTTTTTSVTIAFSGYDWFLATVFILIGGQPGPTLDFLSHIIGYMPSMYLWPQRSHRSALLLPHRQDIPLLYSTCCHMVEYIAEAELPSLFSAFTLSGCTPSQISQRWMREMFWNTLPLPEIANYLLLSMSFGIDYQIYFCIALLRHITPDVLLATRDHELITYLHEAEAVGATFSAGAHLAFMKELELRYRDTILQEMKEAVVINS
ncbi:broad-minded protein-domain-containing protein [Powellomyces hirtus]|nr:broad-minded protein-domain-containing protein [Powellomyces hirtus]